jgi:hypothetical protein
MFVKNRPSDRCLSASRCFSHLNKKMALAEISLLPDCRASPSPLMDLLV